MSNFYQAAIEAVAQGFLVFPVQPNGKAPLTKNGQDNATDDLAVIEGWAAQYPANANLGIHCAPSGLYVVDIDNGGDKTGDETWAALVAQHGHVDTYTVRTQSGGLHFYYRMPEGEPLKNTAGKLGKHIDTRGNGYVLGAGSSIDGRAYELVNEVPIADLPEWIAEACRKPKPTARPIAGTGQNSSSGRQVMPYELAEPNEVEARVLQLAAELASAPDGEGNHTAARVAFMVGGYVGAGQISVHLAQSILEGALAGWSFRDAASERGMYSTIERQLAEGAMTPRPWVNALFLGSQSTDGTGSTETRAAAIELPEDADEKKKQLTDPTDWATDGGQARWISESTSGGLRHCKGVGWLKWDGKRWDTCTDEQIGSFIVAFYKAEFAKAVAAWKSDPTNEAKHRKATFLAKQQAASKVRAVRDLLKMIRSLEGAEPANRLDAHPHLLNTPAGVVDLRTGQVGQHDPTLLLTRITNGNYVPGFRHDDWNTTVASCLPHEVWDYLQLRMGASLVSDSHPDTMIFLFGARGRNGKSSIGDDGCLPALGDYGHLAPAHVLSGGGGKDGALSPDKAELRGRRFVLIEELEEGSSFSSNEAKRLIGTGSLSARTLHEKPMTFNATHTLFATTNHEPNVPETTEAAWRRLLMVKFEYEFVLNPTEPHQRKGDPTLKHRLRKGEDGQHDAIVTWLVEGAMRYYTDPVAILKDREPAIVTEWTAAWRSKADRVFAYASERLTFEPDGLVATTDLFEDVNNWLTGNGYSKWSKKTFLDRLMGHALFDGRVSRSQTTKVEEISRPDTEYPAKLSARPEVLKGIRFSEEQPRPCVCANGTWGEHHPSCSKYVAP